VHMRAPPVLWPLDLDYKERDSEDSAIATGARAPCLTGAVLMQVVRCRRQSPATLSVYRSLSAAQTESSC
jgi:hypothetical protein